ncbi:TetR/AcrR family transcriptional regulator [Pseudoduganella namucuonensis]|uniref:Transcriptional regulator, TetR family n=1 Tax=Pseudoduganella namucuonensis TaxID=1035707 RepID=A0A1I7L726_9BURK|nr:TetR/AcrR family transcriptional regulator [Pseudoduganella namucuonensis]SFV05539.1 transcriptional regulator, TetR family [Pseudoduganella namucuonensis]
MKTATKESTPNRKESILVAAERLFAARGYHGVSIRDIANEAGVQFALIGYYYGNKLELYHHIFELRSGYIKERLELLAGIMDNATARNALGDIVDAFVGPVLKLAQSVDGDNFLRMVSRGMTEQLSEDEKVIQELFDPLAHAFIDAMASVLPHVSRGTVAWCYQFALGALLHHVTDRRIERLSRGENRRDDFGATQPMLVKFIVHGIRGVCGPVPAMKAETSTSATKTNAAKPRAAAPKRAPAPRRTKQP